jgi:hypothetical protein
MEAYIASERKRKILKERSSKERSISANGSVCLPKAKRHQTLFPRTFLPTLACLGLLI